MIKKLNSQKIGFIKVFLLKLGYKELPLSKKPRLLENEIDYLTNVFVERIKVKTRQISTRVDAY